MSHLKERKEKICLNCNAAIYGRFCHVCGQENIEPKESFWHLVTHFLFDLIHFDGKFFSTMKYLLFKPGFLAAEHLKGRRADYLHPIRLYIFVSAFFFLIVFSFYGKEKSNHKLTTYQTTLKFLEKKQKIIEKLFLDSSNKHKATIADSFLNIVKADIALVKQDTTKYKNLKSLDLNYNLLFKQQGFATEDENLVIEPGGKVSDYFEKKQKKYGSSDEFNEKLIDGLLHAIPKGLFVALPFYALFLWLIYYRNKQYNYVSHLLFTVYLFSFTFILILFSLWLVSLLDMVGVYIDEVIFIIGIFIAMLHTYKALRFFYQQSRIKTIIKFFILSFCCIILATLVCIIAFSLSIFTI